MDCLCRTPGAPLPAPVRAPVRPLRQPLRFLLPPGEHPCVRHRDVDRALAGAEGARRYARGGPELVPVEPHGRRHVLCGPVRGRPGRAARAHPLPHRAGHHLPASDAPVSQPGRRQRRRLRGQQLSRGRPTARHHGGAGGTGDRTAPPRHLADAGLRLQSHLRRARMGAGGPGRGSRHQDYYRMFPDRTLPDAYEKTMPEVFPTSIPAPSPIAPASRSGSGPRSTTISGT